MTFDEANTGALYVNVANLRFPVIGLDALLRNKRASGRPKDLGDVAALTGHDENIGVWCVIFELRALLGEVGLTVLVSDPNSRDYELTPIYSSIFEQARGGPGFLPLLQRLG